MFGKIGGDSLTFKRELWRGREREQDRIGYFLAVLAFAVVV